jgi:ACS family pantothenate transporter-like MFS transporter
MFADNGILGIYLKYLKRYTVPQINYIPTAVNGIAILTVLFGGWYSEYYKQQGGRWHVGLLLSFTAIITGVIMLKPPSVNAKLFALFLNGMQLGFNFFFVCVG